VKRNEIYYADLDPVQGAEQSGRRPVLIVQNDIGNEHSSTVIVCPITSANRTNYLPTHVRLGCNYGLTKDSIVFCEQIRAIDKKRLGSKIGIITDKMMLKQINDALHISIALHDRKSTFFETSYASSENQNCV